ncbi:hypothetical protein [Cardiobacterium hominis]|uniref:hypothetical protein n=1 Tax=Cardiobacterium hominis TaxID=2718 RepID=UPI0028D76BA9|nr:hypothetical protein [Cardiobacterium hominis]
MKTKNATAVADGADCTRKSRRGGLAAAWLKATQNSSSRPRFTLRGTNPRFTLRGTKKCAEAHFAVWQDI